MRPARRGFTLIELLVVLAIIGVLAALTASATIKFIGVQQASNTKIALAKLQSQVDAQWSAVTQRGRDEAIPDALQFNADFAAMAGSDAHAAARARVVYVKLKQRQAFPMTFDEALNPAPLPPLAPYVTFLKGQGITRSTPRTAPFESAICLLMALERSPGGSGTRSEDLGGGTVVATLTLPSGRQVSYLADAWKNPLVFCRWPSGSVDLNPGGPAAGRNDPGDPEGLLNVPAWLALPGARVFRRDCHALPRRGGGAGPSSYRLAPQLVSAGPDGKLDLDLATLAETGRGAKDNLYSPSGR